VTDPAAARHLFVYGTLRPGDVRWRILEPFVVDDGFDDTVPGALYDTGHDYPAARFGPRGTIHGRTFGLFAASLERCLAVLDEVEGTVAGLYHRVLLTTDRGVRAWAYEYGDGLQLTPIPSGDWTVR
jgi:gamma-glutamylcyclotransferase (GGCT)/AIG2-like uncharacterized protein YtfP